MCLKSTTTRLRPDLNRLVSFSSNGFAVLLSTRPLISTIVTSPRCSSAILIITSSFYALAGREIQSFLELYSIVSSAPTVVHLVHERIDEMKPQPADCAASQVARREDGSCAPRIERFGVVFDLGNHGAAVDQQADRDMMERVV